MRWVLGITLVCSLGMCDDKFPQDWKPTAQDLVRGERLFQGHCAPCHGPRGDGGRGPGLNRAKLPCAATDEVLFSLIKTGIEGTEMPGAWQMIDREVLQVMAYVRTLGRLKDEALPGDAARGERLYRTKGGCASCHTIQGQGATTGPDLTDIGARRSPAYVREALLAPGASVPEGFLQVRLRTRDGRSITGARLNENTFSIQVRDYSGRLHSFLKSELAELNKEPGRSPMPAYGELFSSQELDDLVAYLASLRGER